MGSMKSYPPITCIATPGDWPSFSADGSQVVYVKHLASLWTVPSTGGTSTVLVPGRLNFQATRPDWSWNPKTIAFTATQRAKGVTTSTIWQVDSDGSNLQPINYTGDLDNTFYPSWCRDLHCIVAMDGGSNGLDCEPVTGVGVALGPNPNVVLYRFDLKYGTASALTRLSNITAGRPSVNPTGTAVAFAGKKGPFDNKYNQIWSVTPPEEKAVQLDPGLGRSPNWSPDGKWILFESSRNYDIYQLFVIPATGGRHPVALTDGSADATHGEWSRQQDRIVFHLDGTGIVTFEVPPEFQMRGRAV